jgi:hypothetical protein
MIWNMENGSYGPTLGDLHRVEDDPLFIVPSPKQEVRVTVSKREHEIRFDGETEHDVTVIIRPKPSV